MIVLSDVIVQFQGVEYRFVKDKPVDSIPDELAQILAKDGWISGYQDKRKEGK